jgi:tetratricopeptide (TPR) repeat protein
MLIKLQDNRAPANWNSVTLSLSMRKLCLLGYIIVSMLVILSPGFANTPAEAIKLNNEAVTLIVARNTQGAIEKLTEALRMDPTYKLARINLSIAHNNRGIELKANLKESLAEFHKSLLLDLENQRTRDNVAQVIRSMGLNPKRFEDRRKLADTELGAGDYVGATIEYSEALQLKDDDQIRSKLDSVYDKLDAIYRTVDKQDLFPPAVRRQAANDLRPIVKGPRSPLAGGTRTECHRI